MTIQEAIKSRKRFLRSSWPETWDIWIDPPAQSDKLQCLNVEDILADDWIVLEERVHVTKNQVLNAVHSTSSDDELLKELGFKD